MESSSVQGGTTDPVREASRTLREVELLEVDKDLDLRFYRPRLVPPLSVTDRRRNDSDKLLRPYWTPEWYKRLSRKLPWHSTMEAAGGGPWLSVHQSEVPNLPIWSEVKNRWHNHADRYTLVLRSSMALTTLLVLFVLNVITSTPLQKVENVTHIYDWFHEVFEPINRACHENERLFSAFMILASLMIDIVVCWTFAYWSLLGDSMRLPIAYGMLYGVRSLIRTFTILPFPEGYKWGYPTIGGKQYHSLSVPFTLADDFFYSGHIGCCTLAAIEFYHNRCWAGLGFSVAAAIVTVLLMCSLRSHYMIDMLAGAAMASWYHMLAQKIAVYVDQCCAFPPRPLANRRAFMARVINPYFQQGASTPSESKELDVQPSQPDTCTS